MRNIEVAQTDNANRTIPDGSVSGGGSSSFDRHSAEEELLDRMTAWPPSTRSGTLRQWHRHALSLVHINVLSALELDGPLSMKRLAEQMDVSDASATGIVDRMEKRGLVERRHDTVDRRVVLVYPTATGSQVFADMADHRRDFLKQVFEGLTNDEMQALLTGMRAVNSIRKRILEAAQEGSSCLAGSKPDQPESGGSTS